MSQYLVFVYGTLRKNEPNAHFLDGAELVAEQAWTFGNLYRTIHNYPALKPSAAARVYGELYAVSEKQLEKLDELEGYYGEKGDNLYDRTIQKVHTDEQTINAYVYVIHPNHEKILTVPVLHGDWKVDQFLNKEQPFYYFAYGSCMDHERFQKAGVDHYFQDILGRGVLENYSLAFSYHLSDGGRADIKETGGVVEGIIYRLPFEAINYLFEREGVHHGIYRTAFVDIDCNGKKLRDVLTFSVIDKKEDLAPPFHYAREIYRGARGMVSKSYLNQLQHKFIHEFKLEEMKSFIREKA